MIVHAVRRSIDNDDSTYLLCGMYGSHPALPPKFPAALACPGSQIPTCMQMAVDVAFIWRCNCTVLALTPVSTFMAQMNSGTDLLSTENSSKSQLALKWSMQRYSSSDAAKSAASAKSRESVSSRRRCSEHLFLSEYEIHYGCSSALSACYT